MRIMIENNLLGKPRLSHLDVFKGICILFIIITHCNWTVQQRLWLLFPFWIDMAVPVFMIITGYVSAMSATRKRYGLKEAYSPKEILCKWLRFVVPFIPVWLVQVVFLLILGDSVSPREAIYIYLLLAE